VTSRGIVRDGEHEWRSLDEVHKECLRCGLRLFFYEGGVYGPRSWVTYDHFGATIQTRILPQRAGTFGACMPRPQAEWVLIEYTGNPDKWPGCERIMHKPLGAAGHLLDPGVVPTPMCEKELQWFELGPPRTHVGWNWCAVCLPIPRRRAPALPAPAHRGKKFGRGF
jgi:hypothetical protein